MKGRCGSVPQEKPELSPPPAMKSNQEAEQSPMDLTSLFNYSAAAVCLTALIHGSNTSRCHLVPLKKTIVLIAIISEGIVVKTTEKKTSRRYD
ncbi:hypothetical protein QQF64_006598 [Cirrhinus molitorella]|uniref:Uncharacterized protein n=1 Tax=Cirrhinus molitorella TaxID=172907 RepID=A0ABR3MCF0_9TELE